jgi:hypothetical protein
LPNLQKIALGKECSGFLLFILRKATFIFERGNTVEIMQNKFTYILFLNIFLRLHVVFGQDAIEPARKKANQWVGSGVQYSVGNALAITFYNKRGSWGMGQQFFAANVTNKTSYKLRVTGELYANLICGNESISEVSFTIEPGASITKVKLEDESSRYIGDATGLIGSADEEACKGDPITLNGKVYSRNRIKSVGFRNYHFAAITPDGDIPLNSNGQLTNIAKLSGTSGSNASNRSATGSGDGWQQNGESRSGATKANYTGNKQHQNQADAYLNQASRSTDELTKSLNLNLAQVSAAAAGNTAQTQQIRQQIAQQNQQNWNNLTSSITNIIAQRQQQRDELANREREARKTREAQQQAQDAERKEQERQAFAAKLDAMRQMNELRLQEMTRTNSIIQGLNLPMQKPSAADDIPQIKTIYYIAYCRSDNKVTILKPMRVDKYSDDSWISDNDLNSKMSSKLGFTFTEIKLEDGSGNKDYVDTFRKIGFFLNLKDANSAFNRILERAKTQGHSVTTVDSPDTQQKKISSADFWNN